jgi:hypothetical protein
VGGLAGVLYRLGTWQYVGFNREVLERVRTTLMHGIEHIESMTFGSVPQRLARRLLDASKASGSEIPGIDCDPKTELARATA